MAPQTKPSGSLLAGIVVIGLSAMLLQFSTVAAGGVALHGQAVVLDGDTLVVDGVTVTLAGAYAPALGQGCASAESSWPCGADAAHALTAHIGTDSIECVMLTGDDGQPAPADCLLGEANLSHWMIHNGWAFASDKAPQVFKLSEANARQTGAGIWQNGFHPPGTWRDVAIRGMAGIISSGCDVCGNRKQHLKKRTAEKTP